MKTASKFLTAALIIAGAVLLALPQGAEAANTASGTVITNAATVSFEVGGVLQSTVTGTNTFTVDNKVNLQVTKIADRTVVPGSTNQALVFTVTNLGNTAQRYALSIVSRNTDSFNMNNDNRIYLDNGGTPNAWDAGDTPYVNAGTFGDVASGATITVLIVADTPATRVTGDVAQYDLLATTVNAGTLVVTVQTAGADTAGVDVVFADTAGSAGAGTDDARDGKHSAMAAYSVTAAAVTVGKTSAVYSDPFNGAVPANNPKAIPGAVITYTVTVSNAVGGSQATNISIVDNLSGEIAAGRIAFATHFDDSLAPGGINCGAAQGVVVNGVCTNNAGTWNAGAGTLTVPLASINAGASATIKYQVVVQ